MGGEASVRERGCGRRERGGLLDDLYGARRTVVVACSCRCVCLRERVRELVQQQRVGFGEVVVVSGFGVWSGWARRMGPRHMLYGGTLVLGQ